MYIVYPKIHNAGKPKRPIVSVVRSSIYHLAKWLTKELGNFHNVQNDLEFNVELEKCLILRRGNFSFF